jgi:hypothetical protein
MKGTSDAKIHHGRVTGATGGVYTHSGFLLDMFRAHEDREAIVCIQPAARKHCVPQGGGQ